MQQINITHTTMGVRIEVPIRPVEIAIKTWAERNLHAPKMGKERGKITVEQGDGYYAHMEGARSFIFHKAHLEEILSIIKNAIIEYRLEAEVKHHKVERSEPYRCTFENFGTPMIVDDPESRFYYQNDVVEKALDPNRLQTIFAIDTGRGKTKSLQKVMVRKQVRTALIMRPTYVDKWLFDICEDPTGLQIDKDKVLVCRGVQGIIEAYEMGLSGELDRRDIRAIIFPTVSLQLFLKEYINTGHSMGIDIERFYDVMGVGLIGMDEVHEHFYLVYLAGIILNPCASIEMSATLEPGAAKTFIISRYLERFPMELRLTVERIKVVDIRAFYYTLDDKKLAWWATKMSPYNHKLFEGKLIREGFHVSYCEMWWNLIEKVYLSNYQPGQKIIILFSTVDMCEFFTQFLHQKLAGNEQFSELMVAKYNGGDSYDDFIMAEFGVSTPNKAGTAIDKPGMVHMIVTVPVDDQQLNLQIAGRPRPVREVFGWDMNPIVWFGHCMNIAKHGTYLNSRMRSLRDTVLSFKVATSPYVVRKTYDNASTSSRPNSPLRRIDVGRLSRKGAKGLSRRRKRR
ncbi:putative ATP-dependent DNA helicase [Erwinia phage pEa_SNUABM_42]|nr:putative ATP-dependent DNA helicase [Erwinia phage pEa_SNUABM_43]QVW55369.1 putative ATP-dependent DNA helicase [Erwinia phage pEa_SNUABM_42]